MGFWGVQSRVQVPRWVLVGTSSPLSDCWGRSLWGGVELVWVWPIGAGLRVDAPPPTPPSGQGPIAELGGVGGAKPSI